MSKLILKNVDLKNTTQIELAKTIAAQAHEGQKRRYGEKFIEHPARIAAELKKQGACDVEIAAAWLHDVIEYTEITLSDLEAWGVSDRIVDVVELLTHKPENSYTQYISKMRGDSQESIFPYARRIKTLDILDNLHSIKPKDLSKSQKDKYELAYYLLTGEIL